MGLLVSWPPIIFGQHRSPINFPKISSTVGVHCRFVLNIFWHLQNPGRVLCICEGHMAASEQHNSSQEPELVPFAFPIEVPWLEGGTSSLQSEAEDAIGPCTLTWTKPTSPILGQCWAMGGCGHPGTTFCTPLRALTELCMSSGHTGGWDSQNMRIAARVHARTQAEVQ